MSLVQSQGALNWVRIAQTLGSRTPKQCRERYHQNLKPSLNHNPITPEEGLLIERLVHELGKRWAEIARQLDGRSDNAVKNWWNGSQNRRRRMDRRRAAHSSAQYTERHDLSSFSPPDLSLGQSLPRPTYARQGPRSPIYTDTNMTIEAPLLSPSSSEVHCGEAHEGAPSLISDSGSSYTTSPRRPPSSLCSPVELPPLRHMESSSPRSSLLGNDPRLPGFNSLASSGYIQDTGPRLPPILAVPDCLSNVSHLPTAPNSPVMQLRPLSQSRPIADKDARMDVSALLE